MKSRKRLCAAMLCVALIAADMMPAGIQAYAKAPETIINESVSRISGEMTEAADKDTEETADTGGGNGTNEDAVPDAGSGTNADAGNETGEEGQPDEGIDMGSQPGEGAGSDVKPGEGAGSDSQPDEGTGTEADTDTQLDEGTDENGQPGDGVETEGQPDEGTGTEGQPEEGTEEVAEPEEGTEPDAAVEDFEDGVSTEQDGEETEYPIEELAGYNLRAIQMKPGSYSAEFSANSSKSLDRSKFKVMYTTEVDAARDFFKNKSKITVDELGAAGESFKAVEFQNWDSRYENGVYVTKGAFTGDGTLKPNTTYYYRFVYYSVQAENGQNVPYYSFLTVPEQFTTGQPVETSAVSIKDVTVETGYRNVKVVWTVDNPDQEEIFVHRLSYLDGTTVKERTPLEFGYYENGNYIVVPNKYYATIYNAEQASNVKIETKVKIGEGTEHSIIFDQMDTALKNKSDAEWKVTDKIGSGRLQKELALTPSYDVDGYMSIQFNYREVKNKEEGDGESENKWSSKSGGLSHKDGSASGKIEVDGLTAGTEYEYYIEFRNNTSIMEVPAEWLTYLGSEENPKRFTTKNIVTIADTEFPDAVFRKFLRRELGLEEGVPVTSDKLETLTSITWWRNSTDGEIKSLQGIKHIENLRDVTVIGHTVTDVGDLCELQELASINLRDNDLTEMPDLSNLPKLTRVMLDRNKIKADTITADKLPAAVLADNPDWIEDTKLNQRGEVYWILAPEYYASEDARPFAIRIYNLKNVSSASSENRKYTLTLTIDGKSVSSQKHIYYDGSDCFYMKDILKAEDGTGTGLAVTENVPCTAVITLKDEYGTVWLDTTETIKFTADSQNPTAKTKYFSTSEMDSVGIEIEGLPLTLEKEIIKDVTLEDQKGNTFGRIVSTDKLQVFETGYNRYEDTLGVIYDLMVQRKSLSVKLSFAKYLPSGEYTAVITTTDGTAYRAPRAVVVKGAAILNDLVSSKNYDQYGEYVYVDLKGSNIDSAKIRPVFYSGRQQLTEYVGAIACSEEAVTYKLKKLHPYYGCWSGRTSYEYKIDADAGYEYVDNISSKSCLFDFELDLAHDFILFEHFNYKKNSYEVKTDTTIADETEVSVSVFSDSKYTNVKGTAKGEVKNGQLSFQFKNAQGAVYQPPQYQYSYFRYSYVGSDGVQRTFDHKAEVQWYNYYGGGSIYTKSDMILQWESRLTSLDLDISIPQQSVDGTKSVSAAIYSFSNSSAVIGEAVELTGKADQTQAYINYTGKWTDAEGLDVGEYTIRYTQGGKQLYAQNLYVYDSKKFYMDGQTVQRETSGNISVQVWSQQLYGEYFHKYNGAVSNAQALKYWNDGKYKLELFDRFGNPITGWSIASVRWSRNLYLDLKDVPEGYAGYYAKVTKNGELGIRLWNGEVYYANANDSCEEYGQWTALPSAGLTFFVDGLQHAYTGIHAFNKKTYPIKVTVTRPYDTELIAEFTVPYGNSSSYTFTEADVAGTDAEEVYQLRAEGADGEMAVVTGYIAAYKSNQTPVDATDVTLDKTTLNLQIGQTEQLTATVQPVTATNKTVTWVSSDTAVAMVDSQGKVVALKTGTTTITASTNNGKTASCEVRVTNYALDTTELTFELPQDQDRTETLKVMDGEQAVDNALVTWSSTNADVAAVSTDGIVTPKKAGTANILAEIKDGPILLCKVTVSRDVEGVRMTETKCDLKAGDTEQMQLRFDPSDSHYTGVITWTSADQNIATVDANGLVKAVGAGKTTITASVTVKTGTLEATCEVTVTEVTQKPAEDKIPTGLTALTNEQLILGDVALPDGWKWSYPEVSLKQFAGIQAKSFAAEYEEDGKEPYRTSLPVRMTTVTGIAVSAAGGSNTLREGDMAELVISWKINGTPMDLSSYERKVEWSSSKEGVAAVTVSEDTKKASLLAKSAGKTTITAKVKFAENKVYQTKYNVIVTKEAGAQITAVSVDNFTANEDQTVHQGTVETQTTILHVTMTGASKLTSKSNNAKVLSVGKETAQGDQYQIPLTIKAAGAATITLTANDEAKTARTIRLEVTDPKPEISESTLTVNLQRTTGTMFFLYPNEKCSVKTEATALEGENAALFELHSNADGSYIIFAKENTKTGSYKLSIKGTALYNGEEKPYSGVAFTVKVVDQKPKYKVKQSGKVNVFYKNAESLLDITSEETLESAGLSTDCDFTLGKGADGAYYLSAKTSGQQPKDYETQGKLTLQFAGYKSFEVPVKIAVENKKPKVTLDSKNVTLYPAAGLDHATIGVKVDGKVYIPAAGSVSLGQAGKFTIGTDADKLLLQGSGLADKNESMKVTIKIQDASWSEAVAISYTIKVKTGKPSVKLQKTKVQLNTNVETWAYDTASTTVMWKDGAAFETENVTVVSSDGKTNDILFDYDQENRRMIAKLNKPVKAGSYKFSVRVNVTDTVIVTAPLTVKVVDVAKDKAVKVSAKGNIDVLNRTGSFVTVTPSLKSLNGTVKDVSLSGRAGHLFRAECEDGKIRIYAKEDMALITKYAYKVKLNLTIENADGSRMAYTTPDVTLKLKQGKPKVTITPKNATFFSGAYNSAARKITTSLKGAENPVIENVELINNQSAFECGYEDGVLKLQSTKDAVKGKSYSLQLKVTFAGQADNEKAFIVKYSVKVK